MIMYAIQAQLSWGGGVSDMVSVIAGKGTNK